MDANFFAQLLGIVPQWSKRLLTALLNLNQASLNTCHKNGAVSPGLHKVADSADFDRAKMVSKSGRTDFLTSMTDQQVKQHIFNHTEHEL